MSLRFDRKASSKLRSSFSCRSRTEKERDDGKDPHNQDYLKSWSYRQCQFACDYLNLIEPPTLRNAPSSSQQAKGEESNGKDGASHPSGEVGGGDSSARSLNESCSKSVVDKNPNKASVSKLPPGNMSALASLGSTVSIPASCVTTSSRSSFNSSIISTGSSDSSSSNNSLYADLFELGFGPSSSSLLFRDMGTMKPADPFRFSQATLEDTQEDELNAILGELSALQMSLDREISHQPGLLQVPGAENNKPSNTSSPQSQSDSGVRTESPDNDSGFSDNASLLSSGSSLSASGSSSGSSTTSCGVKSAAVISHSNVLHATELAQFVTAKLQKLDATVRVPDEKAEKIRVALEKMRAASVTRLYVKAFTQDGSSKALMVEESMTTGRVLALLADKNHVQQMTQKWTLVEHLPHLHMERIYEDHENMVENLLMWTRDSKNKIFFVEKDEKYDMFVNPQKYFMETRVSHSGSCMLDDHTKNGLIEEFFAHGKGVPEVETFLYLKAEGKKAWKKFPFVLRASGIYYCPKGRTHANASKDLICLATIDHNIQAYQGVGWRKKFKSPTEFGFALKPARLQVKSHRHMKYLCAEDADVLRLWMVGIRIAKYGKQLWDNYRSLMEDLAHEDLDRFGRSVSLASMPQQMHNPIIISTADRDRNSINKSPARRYSQESYQSSSIQYAIPNNIESNMPAPPPLPKEEGFESDCPMGGTIKRKPSAGLMPKIPLTMNTRSIVGEFINISSSPGEGSTVTLQRKRSLSGNSSGSSSSSMVSQIHVASKEPSAFQRNQASVISQPIQNKPSGGSTLTRSQPNPPVEPVAEETMDSLDLENLPPPPPELLNSESESSNSPSPVPVSFPPPPPPPINNMAMHSMQTNNFQNTNNTINRTSCLKQTDNATYGTTTKRGVSFATELSERLKSRADNNNTSNAPALGRVVEDEQSVYSTGGIKANGQKRVGFNLNNSLAQSPSSPKKLEEPPEHFLKDLQRVMQKKWQVAQKCNTDKNTTPHEILGFRIEPVITPEMDLPPPMPVMEDLNVKQLPPAVPLNNGFPPAPCQSSSAVPSPALNTNLNNVEQWVSQHYGTTVMGNMGKMPGMPNTLTRPSPPPVGQKPIPPQRVASFTSAPYTPPNVIYQQANNIQNNIPLSHNNSSSNSVVIYENFEGRKSAIPQQYSNGVELRQKRPPPPVPKRAESTHLSAHIVFN